MSILSAETELATAQAAKWLRGIEAGKSTMPRFRELPIAVRRYCVQEQRLNLSVQPDFEHIEALCGDPDIAVTLPGGTQAIRDEQGRVQIPPLRSTKKISKMMRLRSNFTIIQTARHNSATSIFDEFARSAACIACRNPRGTWNGLMLRKLARESCCGTGDGGDRFQPIGMPGPVKLQDFFINEKVLRSRRHR